jgi:hypothetical protein
VVRHFITRPLLLDVIHAAGALEYTVEKIETMLDAIEQKQAEEADERRLAFAELGDDPEAAEARYGIASPRLVEVQYEFINLLMWLRNLGERLERPGKKGDRESLGLVPALSPEHPIKARVDELCLQMRAGALGDRFLANYAAHASAVPQPWDAAEVVDGRLVVRIPDRPSRWVAGPEEFTFDTGRDLRTCAREAHAAVVAFMDDLIRVFEEATGRRSEVRTSE